MLLMWKYIEKAGSWFKIDEDVSSYVSGQGLEIKEKYQGMNSLYDLLEGSPELTKALGCFIAENVLS